MMKYLVVGGILQVALAGVVVGRCALRRLCDDLLVVSLVPLPQEHISEGLR